MAHALAEHRAQGALLQKPTHPAKQLGSDPNSLKRKKPGHPGFPLQMVFTENSQVVVGAHPVGDGRGTRLGKPSRTGCAPTKTKTSRKTIGI